MSEERIARLAWWQGTVAIEPLAGGITNRNYRVREARGVFVARLAEPRTELGIHRANERRCHELAAACGVAPELVFAEGEVLISRHIDARTLTADDVQEPKMLQRVAELLRTLHHSRARLTGELLYFSPFQTVRTYLATARRRGATLPREIDRLVADASQLEARLGSFLPTLCHNDMLAANLLDDGQRLWLVDWEYGGIGHPLFDLASLAGNCGLSLEQERQLLAAYGEPSVDEALAKLGLLKTVSLLREALWAWIQTAISDLDFDYQGYAEKNLDAYQQARAALED